MPHIEKIGHECLTLTNNFRQRSGLRPLRWETVLYKIGLQHSHSAPSTFCLSFVASGPIAH
jgi:uncharacterized protein YkwD